MEHCSTMPAVVLGTLLALAIGAGLTMAACFWIGCALLDRRERREAHRRAKRMASTRAKP